MNRLKILIADDDREIVDLIELYLAGEDYEIIKACRTAIRYACRFS